MNIDKKKRYIVYLVSQNALQDLIADSYQKIGKDFLLTQYIVSKYIFIHVVYFIETDIFLFSLLLYLVVPFKLLLDILKFQNVISPRRPRLRGVTKYLLDIYFASYHKKYVYLNCLWHLLRLKI